MYEIVILNQIIKELFIHCMCRLGEVSKRNINIVKFYCHMYAKINVQGTLKT